VSHPVCDPYVAKLMCLGAHLCQLLRARTKESPRLSSAVLSAKETPARSPRCRSKSAGEGCEVITVSKASSGCLDL
jgi:hypothetical protein